MSEYYFKLGHGLFSPYLFQYCLYQLSFYLRPSYAVSAVDSIAVQATLYK
jgi:hypothetical protein